MLAKVIIFSCFLAVSLGAPTEVEEGREGKQLFLSPYHHGGVHPCGTPGIPCGPAVVAPAVGPAVVGPAVVAPAVVAPALASNCEIQTEDLVTQVCTPKVERVCVTKEVIAQHVDYEKVCKEVESRHCAAAPLPALAGHVLAKRDADPQFFGAFGGIHAPIAPVAAPYHIATAHEETHTTPCHTVVSEHCVNNPIVVETPVPIEQCHDVHKVDCVEEIQKIPKTVCVPVETKVLRHTVNPFAYNYGFGNGYGK